MSFTTLSTTQNQFLESYLRGTGRSLSAAQAQATYGIKNIRARMTELRQAGLRVNRGKNSEGRASYSISSRDLAGSRSQVFVA
jgi:Helix-turn-helix domain